MDKDEEIKRHIRDLADRCYRQGRYTYTDFLNMADQSAFFDMERELDFVPYSLFGGTCGSERKILRFGSADTLGYEESFPIRCISAVPSAPRFAQELTHRDFLGAVMSLGIERDLIGDIIVRDNCAYIFCLDSMADYISGSLDKVKHTTISCEVTKEVPKGALPRFSEEEFVVSTPRCDAVTAKAYNLSRSKSIDLFRSKKVFLNGRQLENNSLSLKPGDIISVRGYGKFIFSGVSAQTGKGRCRIKIKRYV